jgi:quinol monooxygenase YgiN
MTVLSVVKVRVEPDKAAAILSEAAETLRDGSAAQPGFLGGEILISQDRTTIAVLSEWTDLHTWSRSRYDARIGKTLEDLVASSEIEFETYENYMRLSAVKSPLAGPRDPVSGP